MGGRGVILFKDQICEETISGLFHNFLYFGNQIPLSSGIRFSISSKTTAGMIPNKGKASEGQVAISQHACF